MKNTISPPRGPIQIRIPPDGYPAADQKIPEPPSKEEPIIE